MMFNTYRTTQVLIKIFQLRLRVFRIFDFITTVKCVRVQSSDLHNIIIYESKRQRKYRMVGYSVFHYKEW